MHVQSDESAVYFACAVWHKILRLLYVFFQYIGQTESVRLLANLRSRAFHCRDNT